MQCIPRVLAEVTLDAWLLARASQDLSATLVDGRIWERAVCDLLRRPGLSCRQGPGMTTLFGFGTASGIGHEIDGAATGLGGSIILECKSQGGGVTKADATLFQEKTLDFYFDRPEAIGRDRWWRCIASSSPVSDTVRAFCVHLGLVLCDPMRLPLPAVMRMACHPSADLHLRETLLQEMVRLGGTALVPMQNRWEYDHSAREIRLKPRVISPADIQDLLWLQDELGADILDLYDLHRPGALEKRGIRLLGELKKAA